MTDVRGIPTSFTSVPLQVPMQLASTQGTPVAFIPVPSLQPGADPLRSYATMLAAASPGGIGLSPAGVGAGMQTMQAMQLVPMSNALGTVTSASGAVAATATLGQSYLQSKFDEAAQSQSAVPVSGGAAQPMFVPMLMNGMDFALQQSMLAGVAAQGLQGFGQPVFIPVPVAGLPYRPQAAATPASMAFIAQPQVSPPGVLSAPAGAQPTVLMSSSAAPTPGTAIPQPPPLVPLPQPAAAPTSAASLTSLPLATGPPFQSAVMSQPTLLPTSMASGSSPAAASSPATGMALLQAAAQSATEDITLAHTTRVLPPRVEITQHTSSTTAAGGPAHASPQTRAHNSRTNANAATHQNATASSSHAPVARPAGEQRGGVRAHALGAHGGHRHGIAPYSALRRQEHLKARRLAELRARHRGGGREGRPPVRRPHITQETTLETLMNMSAEELGAITVRELNSWINSSNLTEGQIRELKKRRRRMKNRAYARSCRARKETSVADRSREIERLRAELGTTREQLGSVLRERDALRLELDQLSRVQALLRTPAIQSMAPIGVATAAHQYGAPLGMAAVGAPISAVPVPVPMPVQVPTPLSPPTPTSRPSTRHPSSQATHCSTAEPPSADTLAAASVLAGMPALREMR